MKILVTLKRVIDPYAKVKPLADGSGIDTTGVKFEINPFDEIAIEEAVRLKEKNPEIEIVLVSIGPAIVEEQLRKGLAMGADRAILIESDAEWDSLSVARELVEVVRREGAHLVLMGKQATDDDNNQAGQMLAAKLGWPQATFASKIDLAENEAMVIRETDHGTETLLVPLPAVVTADLRLNEPRYIALPGIIKARSKPLEKVEAVTSPAPKIRVQKISAPPVRAAGRKVESVAVLAEAILQKGGL